MSSPPSSDLKSSFDRDGYVIVDDLISPSQLAALQSACSRVICKTRSGEWPHRRVVGKQFPPFDSDNPDSWGVQHVMHPDLNEPEFAKWYTSEALLGVVKELLQCTDEDLQMGAKNICMRYCCFLLNRILVELFNLLINPEKHEFALRWHRDDVRENATEEEEIKALALWHHGVSGYL